MSLWRQDFLHPTRMALGPTQPPAQWVKGPGCGIDHLPPPHLAQRLNKEWGYMSTPSLGLHGLFYGELYCFFLIFYIYSHWSEFFLPCTWVFQHPLTTSVNTRGQINPKHQNALPQGVGGRKKKKRKGKKKNLININNKSLWKPQ